MDSQMLTQKRQMEAVEAWILKQTWRAEAADKRRVAWQSLIRSLFQILSILSDRRLVEATIQPTALSYLSCRPLPYGVVSTASSSSSCEVVPHFKNRTDAAGAHRQHIA